MWLFVKFTSDKYKKLILFLILALFLSACFLLPATSQSPTKDANETPSSTDSFRFDAWRETPPVQLGSSLPLPEMDHRGPEPLFESDMISTGENGEALLTGQMGEYTCSVYLFFNSSLTKSACPKSAMVGNTSCQTGSAAYRSCDTLLIQTPSGEAFQVGSWSLVTYLEDRQISLFVAAQGSLKLQPVLDFANRSLGDAIDVQAGQFVYTAPDASLEEMAGLPVRTPISMDRLTELAVELPELVPWLARAKVRADEADVPFPDVERGPDLVGELHSNGDAEIETVERGQERGLLVPLRAVIKNVGDRDTGTFQSVILHSNDAVLDFRPAGSRAAPGPILIEDLQAGEDIEISGWVRVPPSLAAPKVDLNLAVDFCRAQEVLPEGCRVVEMDENNNRSATLTVSIPEDLLQELNDQFINAFISDVAWMQTYSSDSGETLSRSLQVTIQLSQNVLGDFYAQVNRLDFDCQVLDRYPDRLYCTGPELKPGTLASMEVFDYRDGTQVFSGQFTVPPMTLPPRGSVSLNCDGTYQRMMIRDAGLLGKTITVDNWTGTSWHTAWTLEGGDPMQRQIEDSAGLYQFGGCEQLVVVPLRYTGSGAYLDLAVYQWNGSGLDEVYRFDGTHGSWEKDGEDLIFERSVYLYGEPTCCPCNREIVRHRWTGEEFVEISQELEPVYKGTPPPECSYIRGIPFPTLIPLLTPVP